QVRVRFQIETAPRTMDAGSTLPASTVMIVNGKQVGQPNEEPLSALNFELLDGKGKPVTVVRAINTGKRAGMARELELTFQPEDGQEEAARLVYTGRRSALVEVPFTLKDVPLR